MSLDDEFQQLRNLEVGNVEKAIREIENSECDLKKIRDEKEVLIINYEDIIKKKLLLQLNNLLLMKEQIFGLGEQYWQVNDAKSMLYRVHITQEKYPQLIIENGFEMNLIFEKNKVAFKNIYLKEDVYKFPQSFRNTLLGRIADDERLPLVSLQMFLEDHKKHKIESKTPEGFSEQFAKFSSATLDYMENCHYPKGKHLLRILEDLSEISEKIISLYSEEVESERVKFSEIDNHRKKLESLDISDF